MQILKRLLDFYVFSNIHVAFATFSLTKITLLIFDISENTLPLFVFFATLGSYNFIRLKRKSEIQSWLYQWIRTNQKFLFMITVISVIFMIYFGLKLNMYTVIAIVPLGILTFFYAIPIFGISSLRAVPGFKLFLIAACWATVTVWLPIINYEIQLTSNILVIFIQRTLFVAVITMPFDIRDVMYDNESLKTLPQVFGIDRTKRIGILLLMLFLGLNFMKDDLLQFLRIEFIITLISFSLLVRAKSSQNKYYSAFFVEALPIFWLGLVLIGLN